MDVTPIYMFIYFLVMSIDISFLDPTRFCVSDVKTHDVGVIIRAISMNCEDGGSLQPIAFSEEISGRYIYLLGNKLANSEVYIYGDLVNEGNGNDLGALILYLQDVGYTACQFYQ